MVRFRLLIKEIAETKKMSMGKLSRTADVSLVTIQRLWHNPYIDPNVSTLAKIADALGVTLDDLVKREETDEPPI